MSIACRRATIRNLMKTIRRETFIALRARRQAHQIAQELLNPSLDLKQTYCRKCGKFLRMDRLDRHDQIPCHRCGHVNIVPHELAERIRAEIPVAPPARSEIAQWEYIPSRPTPTLVRRVSALILLLLFVAFTFLCILIMLGNSRLLR